MKMGFHIVPFDAFMIKYSSRILRTAAPPLQRQDQLFLISHECASVRGRVSGSCQQAGLMGRMQGKRAIDFQKTAHQAGQLRLAAGED